MGNFVTQIVILFASVELQIVEDILQDEFEIQSHHIIPLPPKVANGH